MSVPPEIRKLLLPIYESKGGKCRCGMKFDPRNGLIPRAMIGARNGVQDVVLIVVGQNPGFPPMEESEAYRKALESNPPDKADALFRAMVDFCEKLHLEKKLPYHQHLMNDLLIGLPGLPDGEAVLNRVYFTELLKCSFEKKDEGARLFSPKYRNFTYKCAREILVEELRLFPNAKGIVALGHQVQDALFLQTHPEVVYVPYPRLYTPKEYEAAKNKLRWLLQ